MTLPAFASRIRTPRVVFGAGARESIAAEIERLGLTRVLLVCTPGRADLAPEFSSRLGSRLAAVFDGARQHVPVEVLTAAFTAASRARADGYLAVGGGSATGVAKALALETGLPILAVPTTYAGSEVTPIWGTTGSGGKTTGRDDRVLPRTAIYDPELTLDLPPPLAGSSGMNAMAHAVEALYAPDANPVTTLMAEEAIRTLAESLPAIVDAPGDLGPRAGALYGAYLGGVSLASVRMGLHHRLCHILGGAFDLPHAATHAVLLPHVVKYMARGAEAAVERIARVLDSGNAAAALYRLAERIGAPRSLEEIGMRSVDLDHVIARAGEEAAGQVTEADLRNLLQGAFAGLPPGEAAFTY